MIQQWCRGFVYLVAIWEHVMSGKRFMTCIFIQLLYILTCDIEHGRNRFDSSTEFVCRTGKRGQATADKLITNCEIRLTADFSVYLNFVSWSQPFANHRVCNCFYTNLWLVAYFISDGKSPAVPHHSTGVYTRTSACQSVFRDGRCS